MLEVKDLYQNYFYGTNALNGISFVLNEGEKLAVVSNNGGSKTSLLKCIAGLFPASSGSIVLNGKDITNLKIKDRGVRLVYDDGGLIRNRSVLFNLTYPLKIRKMPKNERLSLAYNTAKEYGLEPFVKEMTFRLFTPEIIALSLSRLELRKSPLTLIDDVFSLANGKEREELFNKFLPKLQKIEGNAIFATDSIQEAVSFADKILILNNGYQDQIGTIAELKDNPQSLFVDSYVNPQKNHLICNVIDGVVDIKGIKIKLPLTYKKDEVFVSYELIPHENGYPFNSVYKKYIGANCYVLINADGEKCLNYTPNVISNVLINKSTIKIFDRVNEKVLTHELI